MTEAIQKLQAMRARYVTAGKLIEARTIAAGIAALKRPAK
jgi:hypothetical protein